MALVSKVVRTEYERRCQTDWDEKTDDPINLLLGRNDGLYHHHFAVGDYDRSVLDRPPDRREMAILDELHRMETAQVGLILDALTPLPPRARVMDGGSGRGGTSFMIRQRLGAEVVGINFCRHHIEFAERLASERGWDDLVSFRFANMADTGLPDNCFDAIVTNETTMYVDLDETFSEFARLLRPGGRYVCVTWCGNDIAGADRSDIDAIDAHYVCHIHDRSHYFAMLAAHGLVPSLVHDYTREAIPYWELRSQATHATGVEPYYLRAHRANRLNYLVIRAEARKDR
ncbi:methyltransferase domain-containing protein [Nocardia sp. ET3-3]|uniref:Methyltransferase domain-containing protein n=1 Tax=Nocardia terrae TaxID=2675851 RepID=A0A7K1V320_9NOCA|nr:methyltransferase domain-containing protein [Nocardia terrae]MVU80892.1 methyltransferase domain-containing protein [Nocardia terrae]